MTKHGLALPAFNKPLVDGQITRREAAEDNLLKGRYAVDEVHDLTDGDPRGQVDRVSVDTRADARKGNALDTLCHGNGQGTPVTGRQQGRLPLGSAAPDRPHRMDDELRRQPVAFGCLGIPRLAATQQAAFMYEVGTGCPMNGPIHPVATKQGRVRRVDNGVNRQRRDIGPDSAEDGFWL